MPIADEAARFLREQDRKTEAHADLVAMLRAINSGQPIPPGIRERSNRRAAWRVLDAPSALDDL